MIRTYTVEEDEIIIHSNNDTVTALMLDRSVNAILKRKNRLRAYGYRFPKQVEYTVGEALEIAIDKIYKRFKVKDKNITVRNLLNLPHQVTDNRINGLYSFHVYTALQDKVISTLPSANMVKLIFPQLTSIGAINLRKIRLANNGFKVSRFTNWGVETAKEKLRIMGWKPGYAPYFDAAGKLKFRKPNAYDKRAFITAVPSKRIK